MPPSLSCVATLPGRQRGEISCLAFEREGDYLAAAAADGTVLIYEVALTRWIHSFDFPQAVSCVCWVVETRIAHRSLIVGLSDGTICHLSFDVHVRLPLLSSST